MHIGQVCQLALARLFVRRRRANASPAGRVRCAHWRHAVAGCYSMGREKRHLSKPLKAWTATRNER